MQYLRFFFSLLAAFMMFTSGANASDFGKSVSWDRHSLVIDGIEIEVEGSVLFNRIRL